jgi:hypothetical protein
VREDFHAADGKIDRYIEDEKREEEKEKRLDEAAEKVKVPDFHAATP